MSNSAFGMETLLFSGFRNDGEPNITIIWDAGLISLADFASLEG